MVGTAALRCSAKTWKHLQQKPRTVETQRPDWLQTVRRRCNVGTSRSSQHPRYNNAKLVGQDLSESGAWPGHDREATDHYPRAEPALNWQVDVVIPLDDFCMSDLGCLGRWMRPGVATDSGRYLASASKLYLSVKGSLMRKHAVTQYAC
jgi:hypothetical protein